MKSATDKYIIVSMLLLHVLLCSRAISDERAREKTGEFSQEKIVIKPTVDIKDYSERELRRFISVSSYLFSRTLIEHEDDSHQKERLLSSIKAMSLGDRILMLSIFFGSDDYGHRLGDTLGRKLYTDEPVLRYSSYELYSALSSSLGSPHNEDASIHTVKFILSMLNDKTKDNRYSSAFMVDAISATKSQYLFATMFSKELNDTNIILNKYMEDCNDQAIRKAIYQYLYFNRNAVETNIAKSFLNDNNLWIAQRSSFLLIIEGKKNYLSNYIINTWRLYAQCPPNATIEDDTGWPIWVGRLDSLLADRIKGAPRVENMQGQLVWLKDNIDNIQWSNDDSIYTLYK